MPILALPTEELLQEQNQALNDYAHIADAIPNLIAASQIDAEARLYGLIPKTLTGALIELGVPKKESKKLAEKLVKLAHETMAAEYNERCEDMANARHYRSNYRKYVLGIIPADPASAAESDPEADPEDVPDAPQDNQSPPDDFAEPEVEPEPPPIPDTRTDAHRALPPRKQRALPTTTTTTTT